MPRSTVAHWEHSQNTAQLYYLHNAMQLERNQDSFTPLQRVRCILSFFLILTKVQQHGVSLSHPVLNTLCIRASIRKVASDCAGLCADLSTAVSELGAVCPSLLYFSTIY